MEDNIFYNNKILSTQKPTFCRKVICLRCLHRYKHEFEFNKPLNLAEISCPHCGTPKGIILTGE